jgi:rfaE bifunctional protein nucleotidyltransferase chain/domain/rfaE bifunctional protein kinase chain/domain
MSPGRPLVVIGDALLDRDVEGSVERLSPDAPVPVVDEADVHTRPGGAGLAAALAAADGREVTLVTALGDDEAGREIASALAGHGVEVVDLGLRGATPEKIRIVSASRPLLRLDRGGRQPCPIGPVTAAARAAVGWAAAVLVADYGRGVAADPAIRDALRALAADVPVVWDPHPHGPEPVAGAALATPNAGEAARLVPEPRGDGLAQATARARRLAVRWRAGGVCVTRGAHGAVLAGRDGVALAVPAPPIAGGDACGAGDRFASSAAGMLAEGAGAREAVEAAVASASAFVAAGGARGALAPVMLNPAALSGGDLDAEGVSTATRAAGGTVVATGGCFDLLHPGHLRTLETARGLGDCLVVCLNSDASVRRLKGNGRPLVGERDRASVLRALRCVDAVAIFDEDTPAALLERLRPHVWAKGGDYAAKDLPEAAVLERWGGQAVVLPFLDGRSTTRLIQEAVIRAL